MPHYKDILFTMKSIVFTKVNTELCQPRKKMFFYSNFLAAQPANNRRFARCSRFLVFWSRLSLITMRIRKIYLTMFDFVNVVSLNNSKYHVNIPLIVRFSSSYVSSYSTDIFMMRSKLPKPNTCIVCTIHFRTDEEKKHPVELMSLKILNMSDNVGIFYPDTVERLKKVQLFLKYLLTLL